MYISEKLEKLGNLIPSACDIHLREAIKNKYGNFQIRLAGWGPAGHHQQLRLGSIQVLTWPLDLLLVQDEDGLFQVRPFHDQLHVHAGLTEEAKKSGDKVTKRLLNLLMLENNWNYWNNLQYSGCFKILLNKILRTKQWPGSGGCERSLTGRRQKETDCHSRICWRDSFLR